MGVKISVGLRLQQDEGLESNSSLNTFNNCNSPFQCFIPTESRAAKVHFHEYASLLLLPLPVDGRRRDGKSGFPYLTFFRSRIFNSTHTKHHSFSPGEHLAQEALHCSHYCSLIKQTYQSFHFRSEYRFPSFPSVQLKHACHGTYSQWPPRRVLQWLQPATPSECAEKSGYKHTELQEPAAPSDYALQSAWMHIELQFPATISEYVRRSTNKRTERRSVVTRSEYAQRSV